MAKTLISTVSVEVCSDESHSAVCDSRTLDEMVVVTARDITPEEVNEVIEGSPSAFYYNMLIKG